MKIIMELLFFMFKVITEIMNMQEGKPIETIKLNWKEKYVKIQNEAFSWLSVLISGER